MATAKISDLVGPAQLRRAREWQVGERVNWLHCPRGGYGYYQRVVGEVVRTTATRVCVRVCRANGEAVERWVQPWNLTPYVA